MSKLERSKCFTTVTSSLPAAVVKHGIFFLFVFFLLSPALPSAGAQPAPPGPNNGESVMNYARFSPSMAVIIVILIAALFFMGFFSIYIRHCNNPGAGESIRQALSMRRRAMALRGLDASVIETFPTFSYAEVKDHKIGKGALECAVCLNEFEDDEKLRLIPKCDHVFHPECIDAWLESHVTCPVCRANLQPLPGEEPPQIPEFPRPAEECEGTSAEQRSDFVSIQIGSDQHQQREEQEATEGAAKPELMNRNLSLNNSTRPPRSFSLKRPRMFGKFRSHSTGHSLVQPGENLDRFTLRLPEGFRKEVIDKAMLNRARTTVVRLPRESSSRRGYRTGEEGGRSFRFYRRIERSEQEDRSDRWQFSMAPPFFSRGSSTRSQKVGVENTDFSTSKGSKTTVKMPSFKCLEPKGDEAGLVAGDANRPPV